MIKIERGREVAPGIFEYSIPSLALSGRSREPLLDACRQIQAILGDPCREQAGIYREGHDQPDMTCPVDVGAKYRVAEDTKNGPRFRKFEPFDSSVFNAKEAVTIPLSARPSRRASRTVQHSTHKREPGRAVKRANPAQRPAGRGSE
jgi:hypothetical protein